METKQDDVKEDALDIITKKFREEVKKSPYASKRSLVEMVQAQADADAAAEAAE